VTWTSGVLGGDQSWVNVGVVAAGEPLIVHCQLVILAPPVAVLRVVASNFTLAIPPVEPEADTVNVDPSFLVTIRGGGLRPDIVKPAVGGG